MIPFRTLVRDRLLGGQAPLWSHELSTGQPLLGNAQSAPFSPLHLLALPLPQLRALTVVAAWQVFGSMLLTHLLLLQLGASNRGGSFAAIAVGLSVFQVGWLYHPLSMVSAFLPGLLLAVDRLRLGTKRAAEGLVLCAVIMLLGGHPATVALCTLATFGFWIRCSWKSPVRKTFIRRSFLAAVLALCLAAPAVLPLFETIPLSERAQLLKVSPDLVQPPPFEASVLKALISPFAFGSHQAGNWSHSSNFLEVSTEFAGLVTLIIAITGAIVLQGAIAGWFLSALASLAIAVSWSPLLAVFSSMPILDQLRLGRFRLFFVLAIAIAAGLSIDHIVADRRVRWIAATLSFVAVVALQLFIPGAESPWQMMWRWTATAGLALCVAALLIRPLQRRFSTIAFVALLSELALFGLRFHPMAPPDRDLEPSDPVQWLMEQNASPDEPWRISATEGRLLPYLSSIYGLWDPRGFDPMRPGDALQLLRMRLGQPALVDPIPAANRGGSGVPRLSGSSVPASGIRRQPRSSLERDLSN